MQLTQTHSLLALSEAKEMDCLKIWSKRSRLEVGNLLFGMLWLSFNRLLEMEKLGTCDGGQHDHSGHSGHSGDFEHSHSHSHSHEVPLSPASSSIHPEKPTPTQMEKLLSTLKQFVRDWSSDVSGGHVLLFHSLIIVG